MLHHETRHRLANALLALSLLSALHDFAVAEPAQLVYSQDFESEVDDRWSHRKTSVTPVGNQRFLGALGPEVVTLVLKELPKHQLLSISFDLYLIRSWDGSNAYWGPDIWQLSLFNGPALVRTTFSNCKMVGNNQQAYPDNYPCPHHPGWTAAAETQSLGYYWADHKCDSVYRIRAVFPHTERKVAFQFASFCNDRHDEEVTDQSWGIDNLHIEALPKLQELSPDELATEWQQLAGKDAARAVEAIWRLTASGDQATEYLKRALQNQIAAEPPKESLLAVESPRLGLQLTTPSRTTSLIEHAWRLRRAKRALAIINSPKSRHLLWQLSDPSKKSSTQDDLSWQLK